MKGSPLGDVHRILTDAVESLAAASDGSSTDDDVVAALVLCEGLTRRLDHLSVTRIAELTRRGVFAERGYRSPAAALVDLLGWDRGEAGRRVRASEQIAARLGLDGQPLPPRLPATAEVFAAGATSLRHVETIVRELATPAAGRLAPQVWAAAEEDIADKASQYSPAELGDYARVLVDRLDQDGSGEDEEPPARVNKLVLTRRRDGSGGSITGELDALLFDSIATAVDAAAKPLTAEDDRALTERQADALAEICGYVLDHGADVLPACGGERPHLTVIVSLEDLERRARSAMLDFGGALSPEQLRMMACNARVVPVVMNGEGQPLDVGRATRVVPDGLRRAVATRDRGCAHPGCERTASWSEIHHIIPWECGGETRLDNLVMLCRLHHRLIHHPGWSVRIRDGLPEFIPPRWVDSAQRARRKPALLAG